MLYMMHSTYSNDPVGARRSKPPRFHRVREAQHLALRLQVGVSHAGLASNEKLVPGISQNATEFSLSDAVLHACERDETCEEYTLSLLFKFHISRV